MGCASSTPIVKEDEVVKTSSPKIHEHRAKTNTAGTESMAANGGGTDHAVQMNHNHTAATTDNATNTNINNNEMNGTATTCAVLGGNLNIRYACLSRRGRDPDDLSKPNQDAYSVHEQLHQEDAGLFGVYDGHGPLGQECSQFVQRRLPELIKCKLKENSTQSYQSSLHDAHVECNEELRASTINDAYSGTTCITIYVHGENSRKLTICNVGDSRAIMGTPATNDGLRAVPLSSDQTPKRSDEATRCQQFGARILTFGEIDPASNEDDDSDIEDPPRIWSKKGNYPGVAFTRSMGDAVAETLGVFAEPEQLTVKFSPKEVKVIVLASDGIFDVMSNQDVIDVCHEHYHQQDPMQACRAVVAKSHKEWLINDECQEGDDAANYDDMTIICIFLEDEDGVAGATSTATSTDSNDMQLPSTTTSQPEKPQQKRVRHKQKTLRNLEEMGIEE